MGLYSRRFWNSVIQLDQKVSVALTTCDSAIRRFRLSRTLIVEEARMEFQHDLCESLAELRNAVRDLRRFQDRNPS